MEIEKTINKTEALTLLKAVTNALESNVAVEINVSELNIAFPKKVDISLEYEVDDDETELEIEFKWSDIKKGRKPKFELFTGANEQWYFRLRAPNGEVILASEGYQNKQGALGGIESVKKNAQPEQFEIRESIACQPYFVLKAKNHQIIGTSQMYERQAGCHKGIKSVIKNASQAEASLD